MTVYVAEQGEYDDRCVIGVYATKESAIERIGKCSRKGWVPIGDAADDLWWNGLEWDKNIVLKPFEVEGEGS